MSKRIVFTFDDRSFETLERITTDGGFSSFAEAVRTSLVIMKALQEQARQGFTEVALRDPKTQDERIIVMPDLISENKR